MQQQQLIEFIVQKIEDIKGSDIVVLDVQGKSPITETMIICTGSSVRNVGAIADHLIQEAKKAGILILGSEGQSDADWIVVDFDTVMVHIMQAESRQLYELEKLWS